MEDFFGVFLKLSSDFHWILFNLNAFQSLVFLILSLIICLVFTYLFLNFPKIYIHLSFLKVFESQSQSEHSISQAGFFLPRSLYRRPSRWSLATIVRRVSSSCSSYRLLTLKILANSILLINLLSIFNSRDHPFGVAVCQC